MNIDEYYFSYAVYYPKGDFTTIPINTKRLIAPIAQASVTLTRFDAQLQSLPNREFLLAPYQDAVASSRMEGTISTIDEILRYEADNEKHRSEIAETHLYRDALKNAQIRIESGQPLSQSLLKALHQLLLSEQPDKHPGQYKVAQNYIGDRDKKIIEFVPISPERIQEGMDKLFAYIETSKDPAIITVAIAHAEFEALHPFDDGNGRIGRMLITLMLWQASLLSSPHFYISGYFEENKAQYKTELNNVSGNRDYTSWIEFFAHAIEVQAERNLIHAKKVNDLYDQMQIAFKNLLASIDSDEFLRGVFINPIFHSKMLIESTSIKPPTIRRFIRILSENNVITEIEKASGRKVALYSFEPLLKLIRV